MISYDQRLGHLEAAFIRLFDRLNALDNGHEQTVKKAASKAELRDLRSQIADLETALAFEVAQREALEKLLVSLVQVPGKVERLEAVVLPKSKSVWGR